MTRLSSLILFFVFLQACVMPKPKSVIDPVAVYREGMQEGRKEIVEQVQRELRQKGAYGHVQPYFPVRLPADIRKVWIVDHPNDAGDLVQGHWAFIVVRPERWSSPSLPLIERPGVDDGVRIPLNIPVIEMEQTPPTKATGRNR
ncbi:MAG: TraV family lipoprotein [Candidatus Binatia bacterium]